MLGKYDNKTNYEKAISTVGFQEGGKTARHNLCQMIFRTVLKIGQKKVLNKVELFCLF